MYLMTERTTILVTKDLVERLKRVKQELNESSISSTIERLIEIYERSKQLNENNSKEKSLMESSFQEDIKEIKEKLSTIERFFQRLEKDLDVLRKVLSDENNLYTNL